MDVEVTITLHHTPCSDSNCFPHHHPYIKAYVAAIHLKNEHIGDVKVFTFSKAAMDRTSPNRMWEECQSFDEYHPGAKLHKIENFIANEFFSANGHAKIDHAEAIVFIDRVWLEVKFRGRGLGLTAVRETVAALQVPGRSIVMLQAGDVGGSGESAHDAGEKLTRHWKKLGFSEWSESDESWLLLWLEDVFWA